MDGIRRVFWRECSFHDSIWNEWLTMSFDNNVPYHTYIHDQYGIEYNNDTNEYVFNSMEDYQYFLLKFS